MWSSSIEKAMELCGAQIDGTEPESREVAEKQPRFVWLVPPSGRALRLSCNQAHDACQSRVVEAFVNLGFDLLQLEDVEI